MMDALLSPLLCSLILAAACLLMGLTVAVARWPWPGCALVASQVVVAAMQIVLLTRSYRHDRPLTPTEQAEEDRDYASLRGAMSRKAFHDIRAKNKREQEEFGNGDHAPHWPMHRLNGHSTLYRGVWVDDAVTRPSNRVLDRFREDYWRDHEVVKFTLVEGEQLAPYGKDRAMIRVLASAGPPSEVTDVNGGYVSSWPMVNVSPVDTVDGIWTMTFSGGSLPAQMSYVRKKAR